MKTQMSGERTGWHKVKGPHWERRAAQKLLIPEHSTPPAVAWREHQTSLNVRPTCMSGRSCVMPPAVPPALAPAMSMRGPPLSPWQASTPPWGRPDNKEETGRRRSVKEGMCWCAGICCMCHTMHVNTMLSALHKGCVWLLAGCARHDDKRFGHRVTA